ncbi:transglutaminase domain-containing protein [Thermococcus thermotolerans]|uniref:transglutaminase domain-containing protein n=1 Tax=Thermococcus thermotolerans TaxID=2969672 RepID=UPI002157AB1E|nr:transglutaminase domain-containing protein [Thermococcus thermotolerans]
MARRKYVSFLTLTLLSLLLTSVVLGPALIEAPPGTKSIEDILSPKLPPGNETNETGPPVEIPVSPRFVLLVTGAAHTHYLRLNVYTDYVDGRWLTRNATKIPSNVLAPPEIKVPHHSESDRITVVSFLPLRGNLFTSLYTTRVDGAGAEAIPEYNLFRTPLNVTTYSFSAVSYTFDWPYLVNLTAGNQTEYLSAPNDTLLVELARTITLGSRSDYEKALDIARYLANNYRHVENATPPAGADRLTWFLFESKAGSSYDFASAFVVLARLNGLPARLVEGVYIDAIPQTQVVTEKNRHFWAEVYFENAGWLVFDPLHPDQNVYVPFELDVSPPRMTLDTGSSGTVTVKFERVASGTNSSVTVDVPTLGRIAVINESGIYNLTVGPFGEPGYYPVMVRAFTKAGTPASVLRLTAVTVPGEITVIPDQAAVGLLKESQIILGLPIQGATQDVRLNTTSPLVETWFWWGTPGSETGIYVRLASPLRYPLGWHVVNMTVTSGAKRYPLHIPVFVMESTAISVDIPHTLTAGDSLIINGTVSGISTGSAPPLGSIVVLLSDGERDILIGYGNLSNGRFSLPIRIPEYLKPMTSQVKAYYIAPPGYPYLFSSTTLVVRIKGLAKFSLPGLILARPGNVTVVGSLIDGAGEPIANATVAYYLDGRYLGNATSRTDGRFSMRLEIPGIEQHALTLEYPGSANYSPATMNVRLATVELDVPDRVTGELGKPIRISGRVIGIENATLKAYVFPGKTYTINVVNGSFDFTVEPFQTVGERSVEFRHGASILKRITVAVVSPVRIELLTSEARGEKTARLKFRVVDSVNDPVSGIYLNVSVDGFVMRVMTNGSGIATLDVPVPERETNATVTVAFDGSPYYLPASGRFYVIISKKRKIPWFYIGVIVIIGALVARYRLVKRKPEERRRDRILKIIFNNGIPLFQEGESMEISIECDGEPELYVDGKPVGKGRDFRLTLPLGDHTIEARCGDLVETARARILPSYNDAVVEYYERCFLPWAKGVGVDVDELTPREIAETLTDMMYPWEPVDTLTWIFEKAKYSGRRVSRDEFIRFYRSVLEVIGGGCVV